MAKEAQAIPEKKEETSDSFGSLFVTILWALLIAFALRIFVFQPFTIPSESMEPNLIRGDYIITSKYSVGYGRYAADPLPFPSGKGRLFEREPNRGDVIVFKPKDLKQHYIKRLVGLPGDRIQMIAGILYINDVPVKLNIADIQGPEDARYFGAKVKKESIDGRRYHLVFDHIINNPSDNTGIYMVPDRHYFMLGDNRDHSGDSRMTLSEGGVGFVPAENIIGKAEFVLLSVKDGFSIFKPWTWGRVRGDRFFKGIK